MLLYQKFLRDYIKESDPEIFEMCQDLFMEDDDFSEFDEASKEGVFKENFYYAEHFQKPKITPVLQTRKGRDAVVQFVGNYIDTHAKQLSTSGPVYKFSFAKAETTFLYELFNTSKEEILALYEEVNKETYYGKISKVVTGFVTAAPHKILLAAMLVDAVQHGYEDIIECCEYMWAFTEYPIMYTKYWSTGVQEEVMNYTIEHLGNKFVAKQVMTVKELIKYDATQAVELYKKELEKGADNVYVDILRSIRSRMNSKFQNIANAYYENKKQNAAMHKSSGQFDDGQVADQEGYSTILARTVEQTIAKFSTNEVNTSLARIAADHSKVDKDNLIGYISQINGASGNRLPKFIECVITSYFDKNPASTSLGSGEFLNYGLSLYKSIGTSKNQLLREIREILNVWMFDIVDIRSQYQREATVINYTKAVFNYMVMMINHYN